jgi:hypothetical protein
VKSVQAARTILAFILACGPVGTLVGQASQPSPSKRIMALCDAFRTQFGDLGKMVSSITDRDEAAGVSQMATVAELNTERCLSVHSLLFAYELVAPGPSKATVGEYVAFRLEQYAVLKTDTEYANQMIALTKLPGVAREAQSLRDRLRAFADLTRTFEPR